MKTGDKAFRSIKDLFYETRVLKGREFTVRRFATEVLGGIDPVFLGYIEKGKRFPNETLVRRLAEVRGEDPAGLLAVLWKDRILHAFSKELARALGGGKPAKGTNEAAAEAAAAPTHLMSRALAALPDDGSWVRLRSWRATIDRAASKTRPGARGGRARTSSPAVRAEEALVEQGLVERKAGRVKRIARHFVARSADERRSLAMEFCAIFAKGLLDKLVQTERRTYLRNHFLQIAPARLEEFQIELDSAIRGVVERFAAEGNEAQGFVKVLVASTPSE